MAVSQSSTERRDQRRFLVKEGAFTINSTKPGLIVDISMEGLSFRYVDRKRWPMESSEMDIIIGDYEFFLPKIPYEVVYDTKAQSDFPDETFVVKKCGVRFGKLTTGQTRKLEHFIESNAAVEMEFSLSA